MGKFWNKLLGKEPGAFAAIDDMVDNINAMSFAPVEPLGYMTEVTLSVEASLKQLDEAIKRETDIIVAAQSRLHDYGLVRNGYMSLHETITAENMHPFKDDAPLPFIFDGGKVVMNTRGTGSLTLTTPVSVDDMTPEHIKSVATKSAGKKNKPNDNPSPVE